MNNRRHYGNNGHAPSPNGDPFKTFVIRELLLQRKFWDREEQRWEEQSKSWAAQAEFNRTTSDSLETVVQTLTALHRTVKRESALAEVRFRRQEKINRIVVRGLQDLRRDRR